MSRRAPPKRKAAPRVAGPGAARRAQERRTGTHHNTAGSSRGKPEASDLPPEVAAAFGPVMVTALRALIKTEIAVSEGAEVDPLVRLTELGPVRVLRRAIKRGELSAVTLGGRLFVRRTSWQRYVEELEARQRAALASDEAPAKNSEPDD